MLHSYDETSVVDSCNVEFACPHCKATTMAEAFQFKTASKLYGLVTVWVTYETALKCPCCSVTFRTTLPPPELLQMSTDQVSNSFRLRVGFIEKFLVIAGWIVFFTGPVALIMFLFGFFRLPKAAKGWRKAAFSGTIVSGIITVFVAIAIILEK